MIHIFPDFRTCLIIRVVDTKLLQLSVIIRIIKKLPQKRYYNPLCKKKINTIRSLPMWECGLKPLEAEHTRHTSWSLPMWERGLKPYAKLETDDKQRSLPKWERG